MHNGFCKVRKPANEPVLSYAPGSPERAALQEKIALLRSEKKMIPCIIGGKRIFTEDKALCIEPHDKNHVLAEYSIGGEKEIKMAIEVALEAKKTWEKISWEHRVAIFLRAAELISTKYRAELNAATMLGQSKNPFQAEIDSACELIDFFRFNSYYLSEIYTEQPESVKEYWDRVEYRPLEGFVAAITPFNFTSIAGNLNIAPVLCGNVTVWKPSSTAVYSNYLLMQIFEEAGVPPGVINFVPCRGKVFGEVALRDPELAGVHFTGSTAVFKEIWKNVSSNMENSKYYPRLVGETGGKDFVFAHSSADPRALAIALLLGSFEYQGQKCSAASRAYIPKSLWAPVKAELEKELENVKMGDVSDFSNLINAVIDQPSFNNIKSYIEDAKNSKDAEVVIGGTCDDSKGFFVEPTVILASDPYYKSMMDEIFGPVLTVYLYDDEKWEETAKICADCNKYALTGSIFGNDRAILAKLEELLTHAAGNFYINDKPTGAVVGQQPFGGGRGSGTNDKAGSKLNLYRWLSARTVKETFVPATAITYPFLR